MFSGQCSATSVGRRQQMLSPPLTLDLLLSPETRFPVPPPLFLSLSHTLSVAPQRHHLFVYSLFKSDRDLERRDRGNNQELVLSSSSSSKTRAARVFFFAFSTRCCSLRVLPSRLLRPPSAAAAVRERAQSPRSALVLLNWREPPSRRRKRPASIRSGEASECPLLLCPRPRPPCAPCCPPAPRSTPPTPTSPAPRPRAAGRASSSTRRRCRGLTALGTWAPRPSPSSTSWPPRASAPGRSCRSCRPRRHSGRPMWGGTRSAARRCS